MSGGDADLVQPSVGEMLFDLDHQARQLLGEVRGDEAAALLRGLPGLAGATTTFWASLPPRRQAVRPGGAPPDGFGDRHRDAVVRFARIGETLDAALSSRPWPGAGAADQRLEQMAARLGKATTLVLRYAEGVPTSRADVRADVEAARVRALHTFYLTAHAVGVAIRAHLREEVGSISAQPTPMVGSRSLERAAEYWLGRLDTHERTVHGLLADRVPAAFAGEVAPRDLQPQRLAGALAAWNVQAHRTLSRGVDAGTVVLVAATEGLIASAAARLGQDRPLVDARPDPLPERADRAHAAWHGAGRCWKDLEHPGTRRDPDLVSAAAAVRAAYREVARLPADHPLGSEALGASVSALRDGPDLARIVADAARQRDLRGPAAVLSRRAEDLSVGSRIPRADPEAAWVRPEDIRTRRLVPLPRPVRADLVDAGRQLVAAASAVAASCRNADPDGDAVVVASIPQGPGRRREPTPTPPREARSAVVGR